MRPSAPAGSSWETPGILPAAPPSFRLAPRARLDVVMGSAARAEPCYFVINIEVVAPVLMVFCEVAFRAPELSSITNPATFPEPWSPT